MKELMTEQPLGALEKAESHLLTAIIERDGLTLKELFELTANDPNCYLGTGTDACDVLNKYLNLGFIVLQAKTGKFVLNPELTNSL